MRPSAGFTLVELVTVIVVLGVLALGTVRFIDDSSSGFASTVARAELASDARGTLDALARSLRNALPNSVRVRGGCLEYIPVVSASSYLTLPVAVPALSFRAVPLDPPAADGLRVAVSPSAGIYALAASAALGPPASFSLPDSDNEITVSFAVPHRFPAESPRQRFFVVADPVSVCASGGRLFRYGGYGFEAVQPLPATLPGALPGRVLLAEDLLTSTPFTLAAATLSRNAVVAIALTLRNGADDRLELTHSVQLRNVP